MAPPDFWQVAQVLTHTPTRRVAKGTPAVRKEKRRRAWGWVAASACFALAGIQYFFAIRAIVDSSGRGSAAGAKVEWLFFGGAILAGVGLIVLMAQLREVSYRRLSLFFGGAGQVVWWMGTVSVFILAVAGATLAFLAGSGIEPISEENRGGVKLASLFCITLGVATTVVSSGLVSPILHAGGRVKKGPTGVRRYRDRQYQAYWSQVAWTTSLFMAVVAICALLVGPGTEIWVMELVVPLGFALGAAIFAWHARAIRNLRTERELLLRLLSGVWAAASSLGRAALGKDNATGGTGTNAIAAADEIHELTLALLDLKAVAKPGPFRSQSPAATPTMVSWEIVQVLDVALFSVGYYPRLPESIQSRQGLSGELGEVFSMFRHHPPLHIWFATEQFAKQAIDRIEKRVSETAVSVAM